MDRIKKFAKKNKKPLLEIAGYAAIELFAIGAYTWACSQYDFKMVKPVWDAENNLYFIGITGKKYHVEKVAR